MSPDIHWHVGEGAEQETVIKATPPRRSRRSWLTIMIVVLLGTGLGVIYRSIPEPAPRPAPSPTPISTSTPMPPALPANLYAVIDREAQALADGDKEAFLVLQGRVLDQSRDNFSTWGRPNNNALYVIVDFKVNTPTTAWADIRQFRNGRFFRETRFYQLDTKEDHWLRSDPDPSFWSSHAETFDTPHFHVIYAAEDRNLIQPVIEQLEQVRERICSDLDCGTTPPTYTLKLNDSTNRDWHVFDNGREIDFVSPRVMGLYEGAPALGEEGQYLMWALIRATVQQLVSTGPTNIPIEWAITQWVASRTINWLAPQWDSSSKADVQELPGLLEELSLGSQAQFVFNPHDYRLAYLSVRFIDQEYGAHAVAKILKGMHTAQSFSDLIEKSLGVSFEEFDQKWQAWVKANSAP